MMLATKERVVTQVTLEFLNSCIPVFEQFLLLFQKSSPVVHILYDNMSDILGKLMRRFMKTPALGNKYGSDLSSIDCKEFKFQLGDKELVIADATRKALKELTPDQCKHAMLGIQSFFQMTVSYLQQRLPLGNQLLRQLGCFKSN